MRQMQNADALAELATYATKLNKEKFMYRIVEMFLDRRTPEDVIAKAPTEGDARCHVAFFVGERYLIRPAQTRAWLN